MASIALDSCHINLVIGRDARNGPSSLYTTLEKRKEKKYPKKIPKKGVHGVPKIIECMKIVHEVLLGAKWIMFYALLNHLLGPSKRGEPYTKLGDYLLFWIAH